LWTRKHNTEFKERETSKKNNQVIHFAAIARTDDCDAVGSNQIENSKERTLSSIFEGEIAASLVVQCRS
jgi:hypothetical protein